MQPIEIPSLPLGARLPQTFAKCSTEFEAGDVFLVHTDGIYETFDNAGTPYGLERLAATLERTNPDDSASGILKAIVA